MEILENIKKQMEQIQEQKKVMVEGLRTEFPKILQPLFDKSSKIETIAWTQYTPYFNDGEECTFRTNVDDLELNGADEYETPWYSWKATQEKYAAELASNKDIDVAECLIVQEMKEALGSIPEEFFKDLFGDHCKVTLSKAGTVEVEEYEHD